MVELNHTFGRSVNLIVPFVFLKKATAFATDTVIKTGCAKSRRGQQAYIVICFYPICLKTRRASQRIQNDRFEHVSPSLSF